MDGHQQRPERLTLAALDETVALLREGHRKLLKAGRVKEAGELWGVYLHLLLPARGLVEWFKANGLSAAEPGPSRPAAPPPVAARFDAAAVVRQEVRRLLGLHGGEPIDQARYVAQALAAGEYPDLTEAEVRAATHAAERYVTELEGGRACA